MSKRVKTTYDRGYVNAMDKIRVFIESKVYADAEHEKTVTKAELAHAFELGRLIVNDGTDLLMAVAYGSTGVKTLTKSTNLDFKTWTASAKE